MKHFLFRLRRAWHVFKQPRDPNSLGYGTLTITEMKPKNVAKALYGAAADAGVRIVVNDPSAFHITPEQEAAIRRNLQADQARMRRAMGAPVTDEGVLELLVETLNTAELRAAATRLADSMSGPDPRKSAKMLVDIAGWRTCPPVVAAALRAEVMVLSFWMDRMFGPVTTASLDLSAPKAPPAPAPAEVPCDDCNGTGETLEAYSNGNGAHCERDIPCPTCEGSGVRDGA